jgi:hypothetical protein
MNRGTHIIWLVAAMSLLLPLAVPAQDAGPKLGVSGSYVVPLENLGVRFRPEMGGRLAAELPQVHGPAWRVDLEYLRFDNPNESRLKIRRRIETKRGFRDVEFPLPGLDMKLEMAGASVHALFGLVKADPVEARLDLGFGIYRWFSKRGAYYDSLFIDTTGVGDLQLAADLKVPEVTQVDWSGGFHAGVDIDVALVGPLHAGAGAGYRLIVGELWPALALDLENVSGFQLLDVRLSLTARLP